jgi:hypothetical protein
MTAALRTDAFCQVRGLYHFSCFLFSFGAAYLTRSARAIFFFFCSFLFQRCLPKRSVRCEDTFCRGHVL